MVCFSRFLASLPMTKWTDEIPHFVTNDEWTNEIPHFVRNDGRFARKMEGGEAAAKPPPHLPPYHQWYGVISTAGRNLVIMNYLIFLWWSRNDGEAKEKKHLAAAKPPLNAPLSQMLHVIPNAVRNLLKPLQVNNFTSLNK